MIIKEWKCAEHGSFEGSFPICPAMGCESTEVAREFKTAPGLTSDTTKFTDKGFDSLASSYGLSDMSNKDGKAVKGGQVNPSAAIWGRESVGSQFDSMLEQGSKPYVAKTKDGRELSVDSNGLRLAAKATGFDKKPLPPIAGGPIASSADAADRKEVLKGV